jgi:hypothetical protein
VTINPSATIPSLLTEMQTGDMPDVYRRFADVIGANHWTRRVAQIKSAIKGNRFLSNYLHRENSVAFALERAGGLIERYGAMPTDDAILQAVYPAMAFAGQVLSMMELATPVEADRFRRRTAGAFKNPEDMRALRLEMSVATHFVRRGHRVQWPERDGLGNFDLLLPDLSGVGLEVECKSISEDKGRKVHRQDALALHDLFDHETKTILEGLSTGLATVLTVPSRLPTMHADRSALVKRIRQQINLGQGARLDDGTDIRIVPFDPARLDAAGDLRRQEVMQPEVERITGTKNREARLINNGRGGALIFVVQSAVDDDLMETTFATLSDAAGRQLTKERPGILLAGFDGIDGDQLLSIAGQDSDPNQPPTALTLSVSKFLSGSGRDHVVGVGFLSRSVLKPTVGAVTDSGGTAYYFPKRESPFWREDFSGLF